jgi:hypothetical protein
MKPEKLVFVYNADEGFFNVLTDWTHKLVSPSTYQCSLCLYTYGMTGMRAPWKQFLDSLGLPCEFYHRPDFREKFPGQRIEFPAVLGLRGENLEVLLSANDLKEVGTLESLIETVRQKLARADV